MEFSEFKIPILSVHMAMSMGTPIHAHTGGIFKLHTDIQQMLSCLFFTINTLPVGLLILCPAVLVSLALAVPEYLKPVSTEALIQHGVPRSSFPLLLALNLLLVWILITAPDLE